MKKIGLIGCGYWGKNYIKTLSTIKNVQLSWIYNPHTKISKKDLPQNCAFTHNYTDILNDKNIDAVIIATPPDTHYPIAKEFLLAGKDILIEKPMTTSSKEATELSNIAKDNSRILMVGHTFVYHSAIIKLKEKIKQGKLGDVFYFHSNRSGHGPIRKDVNVVWNLAPHDISIINYLIEENPIEISANGSCFLTKGIEDVVDVVLTYKNNIKAYLHFSWIEPKKTRSFTVVGEKESAVFDDTTQDKLLISKKSKLTDASVIKIDTISPLENQCKHFINSILNRTEPQTNGDEGYVNTLIIESIQKSLKLGKPILFTIKNK